MGDQVRDKEKVLLLSFYVFVFMCFLFHVNLKKQLRVLKNFEDNFFIHHIQQ